jgi:dTMP kinase
VHRSNWNSSPLVHPLIRDLKAARQLAPHGFALVHAADFADRYEREILPRLRLGIHVLCDRYVGTALARDGARGVPREWVESLYRFARPADLTFYFRVPPEVAAARILRGRPAFSHYEAGLDLGLGDDPYASFLRFQSRVAAHYAAIAEGLGYVVIDATLPMRVQQHMVRRRVAAVMVEGRP